MKLAKTRRRLGKAEIDEAYRRYDQRLLTEPLATDVRYASSSDCIVITMNNRASLIIPRELLQGLRDASPAQLKHGCVSGRGTSLSWPDLDVDFTIVSLLQGVYGGKKWMSELARRAGASRSQAKAQAARINGAKGGRPPKVAGARTRR